MTTFSLLQSSGALTDTRRHRREWEWIKKPARWLFECVLYATVMAMIIVIGAVWE